VQGFQLNNTSSGLYNGGLDMYGSQYIRWRDSSYGSYDSGLERAGVNIVKASNGSSGYSQFRCQSLGVNNIATASLVGTVVRKMEVFDASGTSKGFVAVYDSIS
jgi:hypothetical protein